MNTGARSGGARGERSADRVVQPPVSCSAAHASGGLIPANIYHGALKQLFADASKSIRECAAALESVFARYESRLAVDPRTAVGDLCAPTAQPATALQPAKQAAVQVGEAAAIAQQQSKPQPPSGAPQPPAVASGSYFQVTASAHSDAESTDTVVAPSAAVEDADAAERHKKANIGRVTQPSKPARRGRMPGRPRARAAQTGAATPPPPSNSAPSVTTAPEESAPRVSKASKRVARKAHEEDEGDQGNAQLPDNDDGLTIEDLAERLAKTTDDAALDGILMTHMNALKDKILRTTHKNADDEEMRRSASAPASKTGGVPPTNLERSFAKYVATITSDYSPGDDPAKRDAGLPADLPPVPFGALHPLIGLALKFYVGSDEEPAYPPEQQFWERVSSCVNCKSLLLVHLLTGMAELAKGGYAAASDFISQFRKDLQLWVTSDDVLHERWLASSNSRQYEVERKALTARVDAFFERLVIRDFTDSDGNVDRRELSKVLIDCDEWERRRYQMFVLQTAMYAVAALGPARLRRAHLALAKGKLRSVFADSHTSAWPCDLRTLATKFATVSAVTPRPGHVPHYTPVTHAKEAARNRPAKRAKPQEVIVQASSSSSATSELVPIAPPPTLPALPALPGPLEFPWLEMPNADMEQHKQLELQSTAAAPVTDETVHASDSSSSSSAVMLTQEAAMALVDLPAAPPPASSPEGTCASAATSEEAPPRGYTLLELAQRIKPLTEEEAAREAARQPTLSLAYKALRQLPENERVPTVLAALGMKEMPLKFLGPANTPKEELEIVIAAANAKAAAIGTSGKCFGGYVFPM